jgi:ABC-type amino acid transport substrate-binding protein
MRSWFACIALLAAVPAVAQTPAAPAPAPAPAAAPAAAAAPVPFTRPTLERIRQTGVIILAHREASVPFSYFDENKRPVGYAVDLCLRVVEALRRELKRDLRVEFLAVRPAERLPAIIEGRADLECGNTTNTAARRKDVAFTVTHYFAGGRLLVKAGTAQRLIDLRGRSVVATKGSTHANFLARQLDRGIVALRLLEAKDSDEAFAMLKDGRADAFLHDDIVLYSLRAGAPDPNAFQIVGEFTTVEPLAIMLRRNDPEFKRAVDLALTRVMIDGEINAIYRRWFTAPIPPRGINLNIPMSGLMRDQIRFPSDKVGDELGG